MFMWFIEDTNLYIDMGMTSPTIYRFTENGLKKRNTKWTAVVWTKNALLMSEVRGEWADGLEMIERQQYLK